MLNIKNVLFWIKESYDYIDLETSRNCWKYFDLLVNSNPSNINKMDSPKNEEVLEASQSEEEIGLNNQYLKDVFDGNSFEFN